MFKDKLYQLRFPLLTFGLSFIVLFYFYHTIILSPNSYLFASGGDGIKNYYTYMFHAKHDTTFWEFSGMNYPFYENVIYTDGHPLLSYLIGSVGLENYGIGILNFFMLLSFPIASVFLYLILRNYKVENLWAIAAAIGITFLTPQIFRFTGHFSLTYVFAIPGMWWLLIKCNNASSPGTWAFLSFSYIFAFFFTHPYLGIILSLFCLAFWLFVFVMNREQWKNSVGFTTVQLIIPFLLFRLLIFVNDDHYNRMDVPAGFYNYFAGWGSVLLPHHGPTSDLSRAIGFRLNNWESWSYVGLTTILFFTTIVLFTIIKRKSIPFKALFKHELFIFFLAAVVILIFSFCFPFKFSWFRWITDSIGPLKQFRVLGRFTWVFYYVITISTVVAFFHLYRKQGRHWALGLFFGLGVFYYFVESHEINSLQSDTISQHDNVFNQESVPAETQEVVDFLVDNDYDAFMLLPFTHMSSENMIILGAEQGNFDSFLISYHSGIPMLNSVSSRLSQEESIKFNNFFGPEFCEKNLVYDFPEEAKIAVIINDDYLSIDELKIVYTHDYVYEGDRFQICTFDRDAWNTEYYFDEVVAKEKRAKKEISERWSSESDQWFYYESWDDLKGESIKGKGALSGVKGNYPMLAVIPTDSMIPGNYQASFWFNHFVDRADISAVTEFTLSDTSYWAANCKIGQSTHIVGHWMLATMDFEITEEVDTIRVFLSGNASKEPFIVDELLIRNTSQPDLFSKGKMGGTEYIIFNNYWVKRESFSEKNR